MSFVELFSLFWLALPFQWEFNFNGSFYITGVREKLDFVCAFVCRVGRHGKKTDILDLFWYFSISKWYRNALIANTTFGTPIKAFRYHFDWKVSKLIFLICCDIFQSKWYRNALIANTLFGKPINACNAKQFNIELERLMFCKTIRRNATPFVCTLYNSTLPWAISSNATPFGLCTVLFDIALSHLTQRYTVCVLYCKWVLSYSQSS